MRTLQEVRQEYKLLLADRPGDCSCPVLDDGERGFSVDCEVHGRRSKDDFAKLTALRAEMFSLVRAPASVRGGVKRAERA